MTCLEAGALQDPRVKFQQVSFGFLKLANSTAAVFLVPEHLRSAVRKTFFFFWEKLWENIISECLDFVIFLGPVSDTRRVVFSNVRKHSVSVDDDKVDKLWLHI